MLLCLNWRFIWSRFWSSSEWNCLRKTSSKVLIIVAGVVSYSLQSWVCFLSLPLFYPFNISPLTIAFFFFWDSSSIHCLAALDFGAGVNQTLDCHIVQNRQAMQSMRRSMDWTLEDTWSTACSSAPHSQVAEDAIPHLYKQERKRSRPVRRRLSQTQAHLGRVIPGVGTGAWNENAESWWVVRPLCIPSMIRPLCRTYVVVVRKTDESLCGQYKWVSQLRGHASALDGRVSAEWIRCPRSTARRVRDSVVPLRRSSVGGIPSKIGRLSADVGRRHPVTIRKASLMAGSMKRVQALRHQTGAQ